MTSSLFVHDRLSDGELVAEVTRLAGCERHATAHLIAALAELDTRRLYLGQGCSSMFTYCTQVLHLATPRQRGEGPAHRDGPADAAFMVLVLNAHDIAGVSGAATYKEEFNEAR